MQKQLLLVMMIAMATPVAAQETMWVANRGSADMHQISLCGEVLNVVPLGTNVRRVKVAPDGKLWVVRFIQGQFDIYNSDGTPFLTGISAGLGNPYDIAFDAAGDAWVCGGNGVEHFSANGLTLATYPLPVGFPLGITIDVAGNKWIAHRVGPPGSVSRIDGVTNAVTNYSLPASSNIQPIAIVADIRQLGLDSHIWVIGDGGNGLAEFDINGNSLNMYNVGVTGNGSIMVGPTGSIWIGNFNNGDILEVDPSNGAVLNNFTSLPFVNGLNFDSFGRLWVTNRVSFAGPAPCEVRRINTTTGALEVPAFVGFGTQSAIATGWHHALVVNNTGDSDADGDPDILETMGGTSPYDAQSNLTRSYLATGSTQIGTTFTLNAAVNPSSMVLVAISTGLLDPPLSFPGVSGSLFLDPATVVLNPVTSSQVLFTTMGGFTLPVTLPNDPSIIGAVVHTQALEVSVGAVNSFMNATCITVW